MIYAVVCEHSWERPPVPGWRGDTGGTTTYRVGHVDAGCAHVTEVRVVARSIDSAEREAGMPCSHCSVLEQEPSRPVHASGATLAQRARAQAEAAGTARPRAPRSATDPSEKQVGFLRALVLEKRGMDDAAFDAHVEALRARGQWTRRRVSEAIDRLLALPDHPSIAGEQ